MVGILQRHHSVSGSDERTVQAFINPVVVAIVALIVLLLVAAAH